MEYFWGRRFVALIFDGIILTLMMWILSSMIYPLIVATSTFTVLNYWIVPTALLIIAYFTYMEGKNGTTLGKSVMNLQVKASNGEMTYKTAFVRNLSKILWVPLLLDMFLGYLFGDSNDRFLGQVSNTQVFKVEELDTSQENAEESAS
ncbi:RDD family protein [Methanobacterium congolense]|uniref:RDD domain containing protein n=1 Tax=Methanobacterium congolense TaxID=118062 RepID=A0A1D3L0E9_9EURY|nr:RDD family protein [Methanobacterium congolense]SCG85065.1 RDD domain containing protein [Methanobacterium congolense]